MKKNSPKQWPIVGQDRVLHYLQHSIVHDRLAPAYLFYGPNAVGKRTTADVFLKTVLCENRQTGTPCDHCPSCLAWLTGLHPDVTVIEPGEDDSSIGVERIRELITRLNYRPTASQYRVAIIDHADFLTIQSANSLLKILEEPPEKTVIVLCAMGLGQMPLTLRSRCQELAFQLVDRETLHGLLLLSTTDAARAHDLSHLAVGRPGLGLRLLANSKEYDEYRARVETLLDLMEQPKAKRLHAIAQLVPKGDAQRLERSGSWPIIDIWTWLLRDALLYKERAENFLVHRFLTERIQSVSTRYTPKRILSLIEGLQSLKRLLQQNVNPLLAFENFVLTL